MNAKIVVVDGLARSGTTLLSSIIHSQKRSACYRGVFHEFLACDIGKWKHDYAVHPMLSENSLVDFKKRFLGGGYKFSYDKLVKESLHNICRRDQTGIISIEVCKKLFERTAVHSFDDLDRLYQRFAELNSVETLGVRWNQGFPWIRKFLRNKNHFWVSVVRDPIDRAISDYKTFGASYAAGVEYAENFGLVMDQSWQFENHYILYFEDLLATPLAEVVELYHFLGRSDLEINLENLVQQSGQPYRVETSDLSEVGKRHTEGLPHTGFDLAKVGKDVSDLPIEIVDEFRRVINTYAIYDRYRD